MTLGLGSVVSSAITAVPALMVVCAHKNRVFAVSGLLLALNYWWVVVRPGRCEPGELCHIDSPIMKWNRRLFWASVGIYTIAFVITFGTLLFI